MPFYFIFSSCLVASWRVHGGAHGEGRATAPLVLIQVPMLPLAPRSPDICPEGPPLSLVGFAFRFLTHHILLAPSHPHLNPALWFLL